MAANLHNLNTPHTITTMARKNRNRRNKFPLLTLLTTTPTQRKTPKIPLPARPQGLTISQQDLAWAIQILLKDEILAEQEYLHHTMFPVYSLGFREGLETAWHLVEKAKQNLAQIQTTLDTTPTHTQTTINSQLETGA